MDSSLDVQDPKSVGSRPVGMAGSIAFPSSDSTFKSVA